MVDLKKLLLKILSAPMVIDSGTTTGTNGEISWMKWSNGRLEISGVLRNLSFTHYAGPFSSFYGYTYNLDWVASGNTPAFINADYSIIHSWYIGGGYAIPATQMNASTTGITLFALASQSGSQQIEIHFQVIGRWK